MNIIKVIILFLISVELFAQDEYFNVKQYGIKLGVIKNLNKNIKNDNYLIGEIKNPFFIFLAGGRYITLYQDTKPVLDIKTKFKKDKYKVIEVLKFVVNNENKTRSKTINFQDKEILKVTCNENNSQCEYIFENIIKNEVKSKGKILIDPKGDILELVDTENYISIKKEQEPI